MKFMNYHLDFQNTDSKFFKDWHEVRTALTASPLQADSQVVDLNCCDEGVALYSLQHSHDQPSLEASFVKL